MIYAAIVGLAILAFVVWEVWDSHRIVNVANETANRLVEVLSFEPMTLFALCEDAGIDRADVFYESADIAIHILIAEGWAEYGQRRGLLQTYKRRKFGSRRKKRPAVKGVFEPAFNPH